MARITVLIRDNHPGYSSPLLYVVDVNDPHNKDEVLAAVTVEREADIGAEDGDPALDLTLLLAFAGDILPVADWRE